MRAYYEDDLVAIYHGDCRELLPELPRAELIFADPPYGIGKADWDSQNPLEWAIPLLLASGKTVAITPGETAFRECIVGLGEAYKGLMVGHNLNGMRLGEIGFCNYITILIAGEPPRYHGQTGI